MRVNERKFTPDEAAAILGRKRQTLAVDRIKGTGPRYLKLHGRIFYPESALEEFLQSCERTSTSDTGGGR